MDVSVISMKHNFVRLRSAAALSVVAICSLGILMQSNIADAASLYKWVDENGNVTYQDSPPPNNVEFEETTIDRPAALLNDETGQLIEDAALSNPVSLYTVPVCDNCDLVRLFLERHSIPFAEKNVRSNLAMQSELEEKSGSLVVPTLIIGDKILDGFSRSAITNALTEAGFPMETSTTPETTAALPEAEVGSESDEAPSESQ